MPPHSLPLSSSPLLFRQVLPVWAQLAASRPLFGSWRLRLTPLYKWYVRVRGPGGSNKQQRLAWCLWRLQATHFVDLKLPPLLFFVPVSSFSLLSPARPSPTFPFSFPAYLFCHRKSLWVEGDQLFQCHQLPLEEGMG